MVKIISDKYVLGQSESRIINDIQKEIKLDIKLDTNYNVINGGMIEGVVKDESKIPLKGALIQLISDEHDFIMQTTTNEDGSYNLDNVPLKKGCKVYALYPNKKIPKGFEFALNPFEMIKVNFDLEVDPTLKLSTITGIVTDFTSKESIKDSVLYLYKIEDPDKTKDETNEVLMSVVRSNEEGYFIFSEIAIGNYIVKITKLGYKSKETLTDITKQPEIVNLNFEMEINENIDETLGEISGIVKDEMENVIGNVDVVLYKIEEDESEVPVAYTETNNEGFYIFNNVLKGTYKVKSNEIKIVSVGTNSNNSTVISPNFNGFIISSSSTYIKTEHDISKDKIELLNNSVKYESETYSFISALGGINNGGVKLFVTVPTKGLYIMSIKYIAHDKMRGFRLRINNEEQKEIFLVEKTNNAFEEDAKIFNTIITLESGENEIVIYNDTGQKAPDIIKTTYELCGLKETINATKGRLFGVLTGLEESFVIGIGGPAIGISNSSKKAYFELDFYVTVASEYTLFIEYIAEKLGEPPNPVDPTEPPPLPEPSNPLNVTKQTNDIYEKAPLKIDINGLSSGLYMLPRTDGWLADYARIFEIVVNLKPGKNTIKFYSIEDVIGPSIGDVTLVSNFITKIIDVKNVNLLGSTKLVLNDTMIGNIGGTLNGAFQVAEDIIMEGKYNIYFSCINETSGNTYLKIDVNGINRGDFEIPVTNKEKLIYVIQANLEYGENIIRFYNNNQKHSPYVGDIKLVLIGTGTIKTNAVLGELYETELNYNGAMANIGRIEGSVYLPLNIPMYGSYKSIVDFIVGDEEGVALSIYVNDTLYNVVSLSFTKTDSLEDAKQFEIISNFTSKEEDNITFLNEGDGENVNIGKISIEKELQFIKKYSLEDVELINGATLVGDFITNVGKNIGVIRLNIDVPKSGKYDLIISYVAETDETKSQITANFILPNIDLEFEKTNSMNIEDSKMKVVTLDLVKGLNIIQIYNE